MKNTHPSAYPQAPAPKARTFWAGRQACSCAVLMVLASLLAGCFGAEYDQIRLDSPDFEGALDVQQFSTLSLQETLDTTFVLSVDSIFTIDTLLVNDTIFQVAGNIILRDTLFNVPDTIFSISDTLIELTVAREDRILLQSADLANETSERLLAASLSADELETVRASEVGLQITAPSGATFQNVDSANVFLLQPDGQWERIAFLEAGESFSSFQTLRTLPNDVAEAVLGQPSLRFQAELFTSNLTPEAVGVQLSVRFRLSGQAER